MHQCHNFVCVCMCISSVLTISLVFLTITPSLSCPGLHDLFASMDEEISPPSPLKEKFLFFLKGSPLSLRNSKLLMTSWGTCSPRLRNNRLYFSVFSIMYRKMVRLIWKRTVPSAFKTFFWTYQHPKWLDFCSRKVLFWVSVLERFWRNADFKHWLTFKSLCSSDPQEFWTQCLGHNFCSCFLFWISKMTVSKTLASWVLIWGKTIPQSLVVLKSSCEHLGHADNLGNIRSCG